MLRRLGLLLSALAMFAIAGGHWAVLQSVAWAGMLGDYARADGISAAVQKTFSGKYPCSMCRKIDEQQKKEEQKSPLAKVDKKSDSLLAQRPAVLLYPPRVSHLLPIPRVLPLSGVTFGPPQPVPRRA